MLKLYHAPSSVCSQKARLILAEKGLSWQSVELDLGKGDQFSPDYLKLNPNGVVPTLDDDGTVVTESSVIIRYLDDAFPRLPLMPADPGLQARVNWWLLRTLEIHGAVNSLSFATAYRDRMKDMPLEARQARAAKMPEKWRGAKFLDLMEKGIDSFHVDSALRTFVGVFRALDRHLADGPFICGRDYALADGGLLAYVDRLDRLGMAGFWQSRHPRVAEWFERNKSRPSYAAAIGDFAPAEESAQMKAAGAAHWPALERQIAAM